MKEIKSLQQQELQTVNGKSTKGGWHSHDYLHEDKKFSTLKSEIVNLSQEAINHLSVALAIASRS